VSIDYSQDALRHDLTALKSVAANAILHLYFEHLDHSYPSMRAVSGLSFVVGFILLLIPSVQVFWRVFMLLLRAAAAAQGVP
jgi:hypothetical protein